MDERAGARNGAALAGVGVAAALLILLGFVAAMSGPQATRLPVPAAQGEQGAPPAEQQSGPPAPSGSPESSAAPTTTPEWVPIAMAVLGVLLVLFGVGALISLLNRLRRRRRGPARGVRIRVDDTGGSEPNIGSGEQVRSTVQAGIDRLDENATDPRAAVIACWVALEQVASEAGSEPRLADTSSDLVSRLLGDHQVSQQSLQTFAELYRRARFAPAAVDDEMRQQARATLLRLRSELGQAVNERQEQPATREVKE